VRFKTIKKRSAFTLIELLIVILIIGILATIAIVSYNGATARAKKAATVQIMNDTMKAISVCIAGGGKLKDAYYNWGTGKSIIIQYGYAGVDLMNKPICDDDTLTDAKWPTVDADAADAKINGYVVMHNKDWLGVIVDQGGHPLWSVPYPSNTPDFTNLTRTFKDPSGTASLSIQCTTDSCQ